MGVAEPTDPPRPIELAVFGAEIDDFSAGGPIAGESAEKTARLKRPSALARDKLAQSGLIEIVGTGNANDSNVMGHWLRKCNGCEADIARTGESAHAPQTDHRSGTDDSGRRPN